MNRRRPPLPPSSPREAVRRGFPVTALDLDDREGAARTAAVFRALAEGGRS